MAGLAKEEKINLPSNFPHFQGSVPQKHGPGGSELAAWVAQRLADLCTQLKLASIDLTGKSCKEVAESAEQVMDRNGPAAFPRVAFAVSEHRSTDAIHALAEWQSMNASGFAVAILGDWWQGTRRTKLSALQSVRTIYWYEVVNLWSELFHWLQEISPNATNESLVLRPDELEKHLMLAIAEDRGARQALCDAVRDLGWASVGIRTSEHLPSGRPICVCIDYEGMPSPSLVDNLKRIVIAYPNAMRVVMQGFPRWEVAREFFRHGIDFVLAKPSDVGLLLEIAPRFSSAALARR